MHVFQSKLFGWWRVNGRVLPWRERLGRRPQGLGFRGHTLRDQAFESYFATELRRDPYRIVVSEIMLQQTQVDRVMSKYEAWMKKWPTINDLAKASLGAVLIEWKGLGYNRRARFLWLLAKEVGEHRKGEWPVTEQELLKLPGIGRYTARAILSFVFGAQVGVVDVNVKRVLGRWLEETKEISEKEWFALADEFLPPDLADPWNQSLMDFGALICTAKKPRCGICPVAEMCGVNLEARKEGFENYAEQLANAQLSKSEGQAKQQLKKGKDYHDGKKLKFEETDRYLRGRIVDVVRASSLQREALIKHITSVYPQFSAMRVENNLGQLCKENILQLTQKTVSFSSI